MRYLVVTDFEATCWDASTVPAEEYRKLLQTQEIIEIGCAFVAPNSLEIIHKLSLLIAPYYGTVSPFCHQLTGISQQAVDAGFSFQHAIKRWQGLIAPNDIFCSWGAWDAKILKRNCKLFDIEHPFNYCAYPHVNLKKLVADLLFDGRQASIKTRCQELGIPLQKSLHRGLVDAEAVVEILRAVADRLHDNFDEILRQNVAPKPFEQWNQWGKDNA